MLIKVSLNTSMGKTGLKKKKEVTNGGSYSHPDRIMKEPFWENNLMSVGFPLAHR